MNRINIFYKKLKAKKLQFKNQHKYGLSDNVNRVYMLSKSYLTITGIPMQSLNSQGNFIIPKLTIRAFRYERWTDGLGTGGT